MILFRAEKKSDCLRERRPCGVVFLEMGQKWDKAHFSLCLTRQNGNFQGKMASETGKKI